MQETGTIKKSRLDIFTTPEKLLLLAALVLAIYTAPTWAGIILLFVQAVGRSFYRFGQRVLHAIRYGKLFHFSNWFSASYRGSVFLMVNGWVWWSSISAVGLIDRMMRSDPNDVTSKKNISMMGLLHDALNITVCICAVGLGMHMLKLKQLVVSGIWLKRLMLALSAQGMMGLRAMLIGQCARGEGDEPVTDQRLQAAYNESVFRCIPNFSHRQRHWSRFAVIDCGWIAVGSMIIAQSLPLDLIWPLLYLVAFGDRFARVHANYLNELMRFIQAVQGELSDESSASSSITRRMTSVWSNLSGRGVFPSPVSSLQLFILHYALFYCHGIWVPGMIMTMGQVIIMIPGHLLSWQMVWGLVQVLLPALALVLSITAVALLDSGDPSIIQQAIMKVCGRREGSVQRVRELINQWMRVAMIYGVFAWYLPSVLSGAKVISWVAQWRATFNMLMRWIIVKAVGDLIGVICADRLRETTRGARWARTLEKSSGWSLVLTVLAKSRELVSAGMAHSVNHALTAACRVTGLAWLWRMLITGLGRIGVMAVLRWAGHIAHTWSIDVPFIWLVSLFSRQNLNLGLLYGCASILSFSVFKCIDAVSELPWVSINRKISKATNPIWNVAIIVCSAIFCVAVALSMLSLTHTTLAQLLTPSVLISVTGYALCMVLLIAFLLELNDAYHAFESKKSIAGDSHEEHPESPNSTHDNTNDQVQSGEFDNNAQRLPHVPHTQDNGLYPRSNQGPSAPPYESMQEQINKNGGGLAHPSAPPLKTHMPGNHTADQVTPSAPPLSSMHQRSRQESDGETDYSSATEGYDSSGDYEGERERLRNLGSPSISRYSCSESSGPSRIDSWFSVSNDAEDDLNRSSNGEEGNLGQREDSKRHR